MIGSWDFNCKDFGHGIDWLRLAAQSLFRISGHLEVFTATIIIIIIIDNDNSMYYFYVSGWGHIAVFWAQK